MRRAPIGLVLAALAATALGSREAAAQVSVYFNNPPDTASGAVPGAVASIPVRAKNPYYYSYPAISATNVTFLYDAAKIQILGVDTVQYGLATITTSPGTGTFGVTATGNAYGLDAPLYNLRVKLLTGVTDGTYLWVKGDSTTVYYAYLGSSLTTPTLGAIGQVCHATQVWGDVDASQTVDSRDALVTLSAAVGLPATGFNLAVGDVDGDGLATSRDALIMLSYAIALPTTGTRVAEGIPDACPALTAPGDTVAFLRNDATAGLYALAGSSVVPTAILGATNVAGPGNARLAVDGRSVVYVCAANGGQQICRVDADTGGVVQLTFDSTFYVNSSPDWSPSGDSIVYLHGGYIWKMAADGSGKAQVPGSGNGIIANFVMWGRDSTKLAYTNGALHVTDGGLNDVTVTTTGITSGIQGVRWSPAGDSLGFLVSGDQRFWVVPVGGGTPVVALGFAGTLTGGDWGTNGIIFSFDVGNGSPPSIWVVRGVNGPIYRVTRPATFDQAPSWRRTP